MSSPNQSQTLNRVIDQSQLLIINNAPMTLIIHYALITLAPLYTIIPSSLDISQRMSKHSFKYLRILFYHRDSLAQR